MSNEDHRLYQKHIERGSITFDADLSRRFVENSLFAELICFRLPVHVFGNLNESNSVFVCLFLVVSKLYFPKKMSVFERLYAAC